MKPNYNVNDFVWAKLHTYPPWPAIIVEPGPNTPSKPRKLKNECFYWVYFFGTHNYNWVEECNIKDYYQYKNMFADLYKTSSFKKSVKEIQDHTENKKKNPNYQIPIVALIKPRRRTNILNGTKPKKNRAANISTNSKFGVIGIGHIGSTITKNLVRNGEKVNIWNRAPKKCINLQTELGDRHCLSFCISPRSVLLNSKIVFVCVTDCKVVYNIIQNNFGVNNSADNIINDKGLVIISGMDPEMSKDINNMVKHKGGRYLEAQIQKAYTQVHGENLLLLTGGDANLFIDCQICFRSSPFLAVYLGEVGYASTINAILQIMKGVLLSAFSEGARLADLCGFEQEKFMEIFETTSLNCKFLINSVDNILQRQFKTTEQSLQQLQSDIQLGLEVSSEKGQPMMISTAANEIFKRCIELHYGSFDAASVYMNSYNRMFS